MAVLSSLGVEIERSITVGCIVVAVRVTRQRISASGTVKKAARVAKERKNARGGVVAAIDIVKQGPKTRRRILVADSEVVKRLETSAGVPDTSGAVHEHPDPFAIIGARDVAAPWRDRLLALSVQVQNRQAEGELELTCEES